MVEKRNDILQNLRSELYAIKEEVRNDISDLLLQVLALLSH